MSFTAAFMNRRINYRMLSGQSVLHLCKEHPVLASSGNGRISQGGYSGKTLNATNMSTTVVAPTTANPSGSITWTNVGDFEFGPATAVWDRIVYLAIVHSTDGVVWYRPIFKPVPIINVGQDFTIRSGKLSIIHREV